MSEEQESKPARASQSGMQKITALQMWSGMVLANLYNSSPGRHHSQSAAIAMEAAEALWNEWIKRGY